MRLLFLSLLFLLHLPLAALARPVSYPDGWMVMQTNDFVQNGISVSYSPTATDAIGVESDYMRQESEWLHGLSYNRLLQRWNNPDSQANFYLLSGAGVGDDHGDLAPAGWLGFEADWESRRFYTSYENRFIASSAITQDFAQKARIGFAPYEAAYDDVHPWLMLQIDYNPSQNDKFVATPLLRLFNTHVLTEIGYSSARTLLFNATVQF